MNRITLAILAMLCSITANAGSDLACEYAVGGNGKKTRISFVLPEALKFGVLIPLTIKPEDGTAATMNTVVLKDYPYLVLADVFRIETNNSRIALLKISPDRLSMEMAYVNMGEKQGAKFYQGNCHSIGESK